MPTQACPITGPWLRTLKATRMPVYAYTKQFCDYRSIPLTEWLVFQHLEWNRNTLMLTLTTWGHTRFVYCWMPILDCLNCLFPQTQVYCWCFGPNSEWVGTRFHGAEPDLLPSKRITDSPRPPWSVFDLCKFNIPSCPCWCTSCNSKSLPEELRENHLTDLESTKILSRILLWTRLPISLRMLTMTGQWGHWNAITLPETF